MLKPAPSDLIQSARDHIAAWAEEKSALAAKDLAGKARHATEVDLASRMRGVGLTHFVLDGYLVRQTSAGLDVCRANELEPEE